MIDDTTILSWNILGWASITVIGIFFIWQIVIARRLFVYTKWNITALWIIASVGWLFFVLKEMLFSTSFDGPFLALLIITLVAGIGVSWLLLHAAAVDKLVEAGVLSLAFFGIILGFTSKVPAYGWSVLLGSLGGGNLWTSHHRLSLCVRKEEATPKGL